MKYTAAIHLAALIAAAYSNANTPKGAADLLYYKKGANVLAAPDVIVKDDGSSSVLITLALRPAETLDQLRARAAAAGVKWQRDNPGNRVDFSAVGTHARPGGADATWSAHYCRYTLDEC